MSEMPQAHFSVKLSRWCSWAARRSLSRVMLLRRRPLPGILAVCLCLIVTAATVTQPWHQDQGRSRGIRGTENVTDTFIELSDAEVANALSKGYRYRLPLEHTEGQVYLSTCSHGTIARYNENGSLVQVPSSPLDAYDDVHRKYFFEPYDHREQIYKVPFLDDNFLHSLFPYCSYNPTYARPHDVVQYQGVFEVFDHHTHVYPCDCSWQDQQDLSYDTKLLKDYCLSEQEADVILTIFTKRLQMVHPGRFKVLEVLNIEVQRDEHKGQRILLELLLQKDNEEKTYRISHYYFLPSDSEEMCDLSNHQWRRDTFVHFLVITKNLGKWVKHFIQNMEEIQEMTGDTNFGVVIVDFNSSDIDVKAELARSKLTHHRAIVLQNPVFYKTLAHNTGILSVKDNNSIVFTMDLHLDLPPNIIESVRKRTIQGRSGYAPTLLKLKEGASPQTAVLSSQWTGLGRWEVWGFGLFSLYKADWSTVGNMNLEYKAKWGGEDSDLVDRVLRCGYEVNRLFHMKLFHHHHARKGMWTE